MGLLLTIWTYSSSHWLYKAVSQYWSKYLHNNHTFNYVDNMSSIFAAQVINTYDQSI